MAEDLEDEAPVTVPRDRVDRSASIFEHYVDKGATLLAGFVLSVEEAPLDLRKVDYGAVLSEMHAQRFVVFPKRVHVSPKLPCSFLEAKMKRQPRKLLQRYP
jgi:hypothetical protein